jgi:Ser/Thr protein kinase RdoA (MazF antagonist)
MAIDVESLTEKVLRANADFDSTLAALHSNPGPPHAFIEADTSEFCGLIDFGDAYISHPAFDLRAWRAAPDRVALLEGYTSDSPVSDGFLRTLRLRQAGDLMAALAGLGRAPLTQQQRDVALHDLRSLTALL